MAWGLPQRKNPEFLFETRDLSHFCILAVQTIAILVESAVPSREFVGPLVELPPWQRCSKL